MRRAGGVALATFGLAATATALATPAAASTAPSAPTVVTTAGLTPTLSYLWTDRSAAYAGDSVRLVGKVNFGYYQRINLQTVTLQQGSGSSWRTLVSTRTSGTGYAVFHVRPHATVRYRLAYPGITPFGSSSSATLLLTVKPVTSAVRAARVLAAAAAQSGKWYRYGTAGPNTFDCSGLTMFAYRTVGVRLPHNANAQRYLGRSVSRALARPGDLVIFVSGGYGYHAGIYAGGGYMYDAPHAGTTVGRHRIWTSNVVFRRLV